MPVFAHHNQNANTVKENCNTINPILEPIFPPAFLSVSDFAVAVLTPPSTVTVPIIKIRLPLAPKLKMSPPTVTIPPLVRVWPPTTKLVMRVASTCVAVENVVREGWLTITAPSLGDREMVFPL